MKLPFSPRLRRHAHSRLFSTRTHQARPRWRLRSSTQRRLGLALAVGILWVIVGFLLPLGQQFTLAASDFWLTHLGLNAQVGLNAVPLLGLTLHLPTVTQNLPPLSSPQLAMHLALLVLGVALTRRMMLRTPLLGWTLGTLCVVHGAGVMWVAAMGEAPLSMLQHSQALALATRLQWLTAPVLLTFGIFLLEPHWPRRLLACAALLGYVLLAEPLKLVAHVWLAQLGGALIMPSLFIAAGPVFDVIALAGLLSGLLSLPLKRRGHQQAEA